MSKKRRDFDRGTRLEYNGKTGTVIAVEGIMRLVKFDDGSECSFDVDEAMIWNKVKKL